MKINVNLISDSIMFTHTKEMVKELIQFKVESTELIKDDEGYRLIVKGKPKSKYHTM